MLLRKRKKKTKKRLARANISVLLYLQGKREGDDSVVDRKAERRWTFPRPTERESCQLSKHLMENSVNEADVQRNDGEDVAENKKRNQVQV